ncbi:MAG: thioredoxin [Actinomycetota bacterium]|nr:thioredoxin [Actinomycetota bacterium]
MGSIVACPSCGTRNRVPAVAAGSPRCARCTRPLPWVVDADDTSFAEIADRSRLPVVVDLWAPWCGPCRAVSPVLEQLAGEFAGRVKLVKVNVDQAPQVQARFMVRGIPTLVVLRDGREIARHVGAAPAPTLRSWISSNAADATHHGGSTGSGHRRSG